MGFQAVLINFLHDFDQQKVDGMWKALNKQTKTEPHTI